MSAGVRRTAGTQLLGVTPCAAAAVATGSGPQVVPVAQLWIALWQSRRPLQVVLQLLPSVAQASPPAQVVNAGSAQVAAVALHLPAPTNAPFVQVGPLPQARVPS